MKGSEALSIASSIATLTGVSFTWLATKGGFENSGIGEIAVKSVLAIIGVLLSIGVLFFVVRSFSNGLKAAKPELHVYYWTFGLAFSVFLAAIAIGVIYAFATFFWNMQ